MTSEVHTRDTLGRDSTILDLSLLGAAADRRLSSFLNEKVRTAETRESGKLIAMLREFQARGGKRLRPLLCLCGWYAACSADESTDVAISVAASLELFHMFALIHDDVMDRSDTRRGRATVHRLFASTWSSNSNSSQEGAEWFGISGAILLGDLALILSEEMLTNSGMSDAQARAVRPFIDHMRMEVLVGQYHDLLAEQHLSADIEATLQVIRYKTAKYTVERPLHLGAVLAGCDRRTLDACTAYALPIGEAFQLRDDILGVFGDPAVTGKSGVDDLRDGKRTTLIALALQRGSASDVKLICRLVGKLDLDAAGADAIREVLVSTGALAIVEDMIASREEQAQHVLDTAPFPRDVCNTLSDIARSMTNRRS
jgi:geranylgeranyl diphosphate synthase type I